MVRDLVEFNKWKEWHRSTQESDFNIKKAKAIQDAGLQIDPKSRESMLFLANKMKFMFSHERPVHYGFCDKFKKKVSFLPGICQIETQECFVHRKDMADVVIENP